jgi:YidC/Oxa1 family membrane protein insertase
MILQLPIFFALFRVMNEFRPRFNATGDFHFNAKYGLSKDLIAQGAHAKVFGAPISAAFTSGPKLLDALDGNATTVKVVAALMIVTMGATTFWTQRQMMARTGAQLDPQQAQVQKIMLYVLPFSFAIFGFSFPIGVLLYWLTTNLWSMGQQRYVIARMPPVGSPAAAAKEAKDAARATKRGKAVSPGVVEGVVEGSVESVPEQPAAPAPDATAVPRATPGKAAAGSRKNKSKKRKGGRR